jgi:beta-galactosidase
MISMIQRSVAMLAAGWLAATVCVAGAAESGRATFNMNQGWEFFRPTEPVPFAPDRARLVATGEFAPGGAAQTVTVPEQKARFICLEAVSSFNNPFAAVAELELLDARQQPLPRQKWTVAYATSEEASTHDLAACAFDGKPETKWHSTWKGKTTPLPHCLIINLGNIQTFSSFRYLPRQDGNPSGMIKEWRFYASKTAFPLPVNHAVADPLSSPGMVWEKVNLPHSVRLEPLNASGGRNYQGPCWYKKTFVADAGWQDHQLYLRFEGAMQVADLWLNDKKLTTHFGGYQPFTIDLTGRLTLGKPNTLVVKLDNSDNPDVPPGKPQNQLDFTYFGGLYRDVSLDVLDPLHITDEILANQVAGGGIFVRYAKVAADQAVVEIQTEVANERATAATCQVKQELVDAAGAVVASAIEEAKMAAGTRRAITQTLTVEKPKLWHPYHPDLYALRTTILAGDRIADNRTTRLGLRRIEFKPEGLFINGEKFMASGFNRHQDHPYVGYALPNSQHYRDAKKMRDAGFTSFRSHYPQDPAFMDACDELGILCIVSNPGWQFFGNATWIERINQNARDMVRRDRNHPSAVIWEPFPNETGYSEAFAHNLHNIIHEEYPGDQCFTAGDGEIGHAGKFIDVVWSREPVEGKPFWGREWGDSVDNWGDQQGRVRIARGWGETPLITQAVNHAIKLDTMLKVAGGSPTATRLSGACVWAGIDCYRGYHHQPFLGGPLDLFRLPKFDYYMFQSQRPPEVKVAGVDGGPMVFIANHGSPYSPATVTVFSNCEEVRFYENGKLTATQKPDAGYVLAHPPFTFKAKTEKTEKTTYYMTNDNAANSEYSYHFQASEYKAEGLIGGQVVATHLVQAPGVMRQIKLEVDYANRTLTADGGDWIRVYAKVCDGRGTVHPLADDLISFSVEGEGTIIGDATIGANPVKAEAGIATVLIRSTPKPGKIKIKATAFGLSNGEATIESTPLAEPTR